MIKNAGERENRREEKIERGEGEKEREMAKMLIMGATGPWRPSHNQRTGEV